jgi:signal transduction histidine kinase
MNFIDVLERQSKGKLLAAAFVVLFLIGVADIFTAWQFGMLIFYCVPVYLVALLFPRRTAMAFVILTCAISLAGDLDSIPSRGLAGYYWSGVNRLVGLLFAVGCGVSFRQYRAEMRQKLHALKHARQLEREIVRTGEREQQRIGQDLHDGVCQTLAALDCAAQCLKMDLEADGSPRVELASVMQAGISAAISEARSMARGIYPVSLESSTLPDALRELVKTMNALCGNIVHFDCAAPVLLQDEEVAMHLYRIAQEALSNAMRHANATRIDIRMTVDRDQLSLTIADNGCGSAIRKRPDGMGFYTMHYRASVIGATLTVQAPDNSGTTVRCLLRYLEAA